MAGHGARRANLEGDPMSRINQTGRRIIYVMMVIVVLLVIWQILTPL